MSELTRRERRMLFIALPLLILAGLATGLLGCASMDYARQPQLVQHATASDAIVAVRWVASDREMPTACRQGFEAASCSVTGTVDGKRSCVLWIVQPRDFNDAPALAYIGHEFYECMGAQHAAHFTK